MLSNGVKLSTENKTILEEVKEEKKEETKKTFSAVYKDVTATINKLKERIVNGEDDLAEKMTSIIEQYLGAGKKITEATPAQQDLVEAALAELKEL
jgi:F0F1-type ATP synthase membrane subunit b/b'